MDEQTSDNIAFRFIDLLRNFKSYVNNYTSNRSNQIKKRKYLKDIIVDISKDVSSYSMEHLNGVQKQIADLPDLPSINHHEDFLNFQEDEIVKGYILTLRSKHYQEIMEDSTLCFLPPSFNTLELDKSLFNKNDEDTGHFSSRIIDKLMLQLLTIFSSTKMKIVYKSDISNNEDICNRCKEKKVTISFLENSKSTCYCRKNIYNSCLDCYTSNLSSILLNNLLDYSESFENIGELTRRVKEDLSSPFFPCFTCKGVLSPFDLIFVQIEEKKTELSFDETLLIFDDRKRIEDLERKTQHQEDIQLQLTSVLIGIRDNLLLLNNNVCVSQRSQMELMNRVTSSIESINQNLQQNRQQPIPFRAPLNIPTSNITPIPLSSVIPMRNQIRGNDTTIPMSPIPGTPISGMSLNLAKTAKVQRSCPVCKLPGHYRKNCEILKQRVALESNAAWAEQRESEEQNGSYPLSNNYLNYNPENQHKESTPIDDNNSNSGSTFTALSSSFYNNDSTDGFGNLDLSSIQSAVDSISHHSEKHPLFNINKIIDLPH